MKWLLLRNFIFAVTFFIDFSSSAVVGCSWNDSVSPVVSLLGFSHCHSDTVKTFSRSVFGCSWVDLCWLVVSVKISSHPIKWENIIYFIIHFSFYDNKCPSIVTWTNIELVETFASLLMPERNETSNNFSISWSIVDFCSSAGTGSAIASAGIFASWLLERF